MDTILKDRFNTECARRNAADDPALRRHVWEYVEAMDSAPVMVAEGLNDRFKLLAEYGGVVLCGRDDGPDRGFTFVTWRRDYARTGLEIGHYMTDYTAAKQDFALRAGLVQETLIFDKEQYPLLLEAVSIQRRLDDLLTIAQDEKLREVQGQLERILEERLGIVLNAPAQEPTMEMGGLE